MGNLPGRQKIQYLYYLQMLKNKNNKKTPILMLINAIFLHDYPVVLDYFSAAFFCFGQHFTFRIFY